VYGTPKQGFIPVIEDNDDDDGSVKGEEEKTYGKGGDVDVVTVASPPYMWRGRRFLDTQFGNRKDGEQLMMGDSTVFVDTDDNFKLREPCLERRKCYWN